MRRLWQLGIVLAFAVLTVGVLFAVGRNRRAPAPIVVGESEPYARVTREVMAAPITVQVPLAQQDLAGLVFRTFQVFDESMSEWKPTSPLSAVNDAAGREPVFVSEDLRSVLRGAIEIGDITDGAFDITWAALWGLWDFKADEPRVPDDEEIRRRVELVDYRAIEIDEQTGTVGLPDEGMLIGLGGIAKGYALDQAAAILRANGVESFLITAGGQVMVGGQRGDRPWRVGIRDPRGDRDDYFAHLDLRDVSLSTSGDYERFFVQDGVRYHHILDPRTGRPARAGVRSATVVSADATLADALSTALVILGVERSVEIVEGLDGVEAVLVDDAGQVHVTSGLAGKLEMQHPPRP